MKYYTLYPLSPRVYQVLKMLLDILFLTLSIASLPPVSLFLAPCFLSCFTYFLTLSWDIFSSVSHIPFFLATMFLLFVTIPFPWQPYFLCFSQFLSPSHIVPSHITIHLATLFLCLSYFPVALSHRPTPLTFSQELEPIDPLEYNARRMIRMTTMTKSTPAATSNTLNQRPAPCPFLVSTSMLSMQNEQVLLNWTWLSLNWAPGANMC